MTFIVVGMKRMEVAAPDKQGSWDLTIGKEGVTFLIEKSSELFKKYILKIGSTHCLILSAWSQLAIIVAWGS
jgi:hypothetical protein